MCLLLTINLGADPPYGPTMVNVGVTNTHTIVTSSQLKGWQCIYRCLYIGHTTGTSFSSARIIPGRAHVQDPALRMYREFSGLVEM